MKTQLNNLVAPWTLHFDSDGTEDVAIICDANGHHLARSSHFRLPERDDPVPPTLAAMRAMSAAPELLDALDFLLEETVDADLEHGFALSDGQRIARKKALKAMRKARAA
jgi:hypothetical protein